jgi:hypothetical protein
MIFSAILAAVATGGTAYLGGAVAKTALIVALVALVKDLQAYYATSPKTETPDGNP